MSKHRLARYSRRSLFQKFAAWATLAGGAGAVHAGGAAGGGASAGAQRTVAYHLDDLAQAIPMLRNLSNHLDADPQARIAVVAISSGLRMLVSGTEDANGNDFEALVNDLQRRGVVFKACGNTMKTFDLAVDDLHWDVEVVASGMAELARLQREDRCAYLKV